MNGYYSDDTMYDVDNFLMHYGVKGMKWKKRKKKIKRALKNVMGKARSGFNRFGNSVKSGYNRWATDTANRLISLQEHAHNGGRALKKDVKRLYGKAKSGTKNAINKAYRAATGTKVGKAAWNKAHGYSQKKLNKYHEDINNNSRWAEGYAKQQKAAERKSNKLMGLYGEANNEKYKQELMDRSNEAGREAEAYKTKKKTANRKKNNARVELGKYNKAYLNRKLL